MIYGFGRSLNTYREPSMKVEPNELKDIQLNVSQINQIHEIKGESLIKGGTSIPTPDLLQIKKNNRRAEIETGLVASICGVSFAYFLVYAGIIFGFLFKLFVLFIIFNICVIIYKTIQFGLDASRKIVGGIGDTMQKAVDGAVIPGFEIMGFTIPDIKLLGFLQDPTDKVQNAKKKIPREAWEVILEIIKGFFNGLLNWADSA